MAWGALLAAAIAAGAAIWGQKKQAKENKALAEFQANENRAALRQQLDYNTPESQMRRYQDAGLNPHLIYGQGSPGNQNAPLTYPDIKTTDYSTLMNVLPAFNQTRLADAQVQAQNASTLQKHAMTDLNRMQAQVLAKNPLLDSGGFKAIIDGLKASAMLKEEQTKGQGISNFITEAAGGHNVEKVFREVQLLEQRFKLGELDAKIKAQVLTSKEFNNAILEVQKKFMTDGDITPQHILQFIQLILMKAL